MENKPRHRKTSISAFDFCNASVDNAADKLRPGVQSSDKSRPPELRPAHSSGKAPTPAFVFCKQLRALLVCASAVCNSATCCDPGTTFLPRQDRIVLKHRVAKPVERRRQPAAAAFELGDLPKRRTAKHKKQFTPDTGATVSVTNRADIFLSIDDYAPNKTVQVANRSVVNVVFTGTVQLDLVDTKGKTHTKLLRNVCYSPHFSGNLLSVREMAKQHRYKGVFGEKSYFRTPEGDKIRIDEVGTQYYLAANAISLFDPYLWHKRFMHASTGALKKMACKIKGLRSQSFDFSTCDACLQGGAKKLPYGRQANRRKQHLRMLERMENKKNRFSYFGQRIATDLCGPFPESVDGHVYAMVLHDSWSGYCVVYTLPNKRADTVLDAIYRFIKEHETVMPNGIEMLWTDNGGEYQNASIEQFCDEICIKRSYTVPYNSWQNPYAERAWGTVLRKVRTSLVDSGMDEKYWSYAIRHAALVHNILCDDKCTCSYEKVYGKEFDYMQLHVLFSACYYLLPEHERETKISPRALPASYLGIDPERNGHIVVIPALDNRITTGYHVVFNEDHYFNDRTSFRGRVMFKGNESPDTHEPVGKSKRQYYREDRDRDARPDAQPNPNRLQDALPDLPDGMAGGGA